MNSNDIYKRAKNMLSLAFAEDDRISQGNLWDLQENLAQFALNAAIDCGKADELVNSYPWLYKRG